MADPVLPTDGKRFSLNYLNRGEPTEDSKRMRARLGALLFSLGHSVGSLPDSVYRELGLRVPTSGGYRWDEFVSRASLRDVLDLVTLTFKATIHYDNSTSSTTSYRGKGKVWRDEVRRIFREENVRYRVDDRCGVHFAIDDEFERNSGASIKALDGPQYSATQANFNDALKALSATPPATKEAIRSVFSANEGLFRLMFAKAPRLGSAEVDQHLLPFVQKALAGDTTTVLATSKLLRSFKEWIDAAHFYRHEAGQIEPTAPPLEIAVLIVSAGAGWVRWLAELDRQSTGAGE